MNDERHYDEQEVAEILERAATSETDSAVTVPAEARPGLTLPQLKTIALEVGIDPARIEEAARAIASRDGAAAPRTFLGAPRSVSRVVSIPRALNDEEWTRLVVLLRESFGASGHVGEHGRLRSWSNGNLQVHVEPFEDGWRVRMGTLKGNVGPLVGAGLALLAVGAVSLLGSLSGDPNSGVSVVGALLGAAGLGQIIWIRAMLPRWAAERAAQMEALADRIPRLLEGED